MPDKTTDCGKVGKIRRDCVIKNPKLELIGICETEKEAIGMRKYSYKCGKIFMAVMVLHFLLAQNAYAYLDFGSGSYLFQILIGGLIGGLYFIKLCWAKIRGFFIRILSFGKKT